jgi:diguanylate cyclase (GGDEF)-like protein
LAYSRLKSFFVPGAVLICTAAVLRFSSSVPLTLFNFYYAAAFLAGLLLAWRFHSTRVFFTLIALLLAEHALSFYAAAPPASPAPARMALATLDTLVPVTFLVFAFLKERGFTTPALASRLFLIFIQSVFVALACRPDHASTPSIFSSAWIDRNWFSWTSLPQLSLLTFAVVAMSLLLRFTISHKPVEIGSFWALVATALALQSGGLDRSGTAYAGTAALILAAAVVETSYLMAYHDELTGLPGRRAFNELLLGLENPYAIAIVDIDHFKRFNDTYGHDTGDEVLRMVASRLADVSGGGKAVRCGGEEFAIVFPQKAAKDAFEHLEALRETIASSAFKVRGQLDRRKMPRGADDRRQSAKKKSRKVPTVRAGEATVTVSIGVAEPSTKNHKVDQVISAADKALYRAKEGGRNRVELDGSDSRRFRAGSMS